MKPRNLIILFVILLISSPAWGKSAWKFVSPMPHGRYGHDAALGPDGKIYVMGGMVFEVTEKRLIHKKFNDGRYSNLVYDPKKDTWKYLTPVPGWYLSGTFLVYNNKKEIWKWIKYKHGMKIPADARRTDLDRQGNGVSIVTARDGRIYWIGGMGKYSWIGRGEDIVLPYDPIKGAWPKTVGRKVLIRDPSKPDAPRIAAGPNAMAYQYETFHETNIPRMLERRIDHQAVITSDGKIYVIGGYRINRKKIPRKTTGFRYKHTVVVTNTMECYDPKTNKWEYKKSPNVKGLMCFAAVVGPDDKIYVFGGAAGMPTTRSTPTLDTVRVYAPETDTWSFRKPMPVLREGHAGALGADGKIYIIGGSTKIDNPPLNDVFIYDPVKNTWKKGPDMNLPRAGPVAVATPDGKIYAIGGTDVGAYKSRKTINFFLPKKNELYTGKVQDTVEVLDISK